MKFTIFSIIIAVVSVIISFAVIGGGFYLVYLLIKALKKYIQSESVRRKIPECQVTGGGS